MSQSLFDKFAELDVKTLMVVEVSDKLGSVNLSSKLYVIFRKGQFYCEVNLYTRDIRFYSYPFQPRDVVVGGE